MLKIIIYILYVPVMVSLIGASVWWLKETTDFENPILCMLWFMLRAAPGIIGFTGLACGPMLLAANR